MEFTVYNVLSRTRLQVKAMGDDNVTTVRIRRPAKVTTDDRGRSVWADTIETAELELVSTGELKQILEASDEEDRSAIEKVVSEGEDGVLARDPATGLFEIISDVDFQTVLRENEHLPKTVRPAEVSLESLRKESGAGGEELSLVSTQVLRKVLPRKNEAPTPARKERGGGFDPYNSG